MLKECLLAAALVSLASAHHTPHLLGDIGEWIDMTYDFGADTVHHPKFGDFQLTNDLKTFLAAGDDKFWVEANTVCSPEHLGTHIDAPKHFAKEGWTVSKIPLSHLVAPGVKIDVSKEANENANYSLTKERIMEWEQEHGRIPLNSIVFMYFNWERFWPSTSDMYKTTDLTNTSTYVFPGLHPDAAEWLIKDRSIVAVGTDAPSIDAGQERQNLRSHVTLYENSVYGLEFVANLSRVPEAHFDVFVGPVKFEEGTGGPVRIAAFVLKDDVDMGHIHHPKHKADKIVVSYASKNVGDWVDLTYDMNSNIPRWPTAKALNYTEVNVGNTSSGAYMELRSFCVGEHVGTHIDAARHFSKNGQTVNEIPLDHLLGIPGVKIDLKEKASKDVNALLTVEDLQEWEKRNGQIPQGSVVFLEVGWSDKWSSPEEFFGTKVPEDPDTFNFPGFGDKAVEWLVRERQVVGFGTETASLDAGSSHNFLAHRAMLDEHQLFGLENLANLDQIPEKDFTVFIMPYKIRGGSGGPTRVYVVKEAAYKPAIETALSSADEEPTSQEEPSSEPEPASGGPVKGAFFPMVAAAGFLAFLLQQ